MLRVLIETTFSSVEDLFLQFAYVLGAIPSQCIGVPLKVQTVKNLPVMQETKVQSLSGEYSAIPGEGNGYPLQYSCLENLMDRGTWWATVHEVTKSWT